MTTWTKTPPREPGWYWFYGVKSGASRVTLSSVQAMVGRSASPGNPMVIQLIIDGSFLFESELPEYVGVYAPMVMPELPTSKGKL